MKLIHKCQSCTTVESVVQGTKILTVHAIKISLEITYGISITNCEISMSMIFFSSNTVRSMFIVSANKVRGLGGIENQL